MMDSISRREYPTTASRQSSVATMDSTGLPLMAVLNTNAPLNSTFVSALRAAHTACLHVSPTHNTHTPQPPPSISHPMNRPFEE